MLLLLTRAEFPTTSAGRDAFFETFGPGAEPDVVSVPGRVNLIGEHIDYHDLPVLPIAIGRRTSVLFRELGGGTVRAVSPGHSNVTFSVTDQFDLVRFGDWGNYVRAAAALASGKWGSRTGIEAFVTSDLPQAAGLSSSTALLIGFTLALLQANGVHAGMRELLDVFPDGEQLVGTRGGGMDHAAVLAGRTGCALLIEFAPLELTHFPVPNDWAFLLAHSLTTAEKSGPVRLEYNARKTAGISSIQKLGFASYRAALETVSSSNLLHAGAAAMRAGKLCETEFRCFQHVITEYERVKAAVSALIGADLHGFGQLMTASHRSLRDDLRVSNAALDELVEIALDAGAAGARVTGAGFGGCAVILCRRTQLDATKKQLIARFYADRPEFDPAQHLIVAEPSAGALDV